jgi:hypothetical protein
LREVRSPEAPKITITQGSGIRVLRRRAADCAASVVSCDIETPVFRFSSQFWFQSSLAVRSVSLITSTYGSTGADFLGGTMIDFERPCRGNQSAQGKLALYSCGPTDLDLDSLRYG